MEVKTEYLLFDSIINSGLINQQNMNYVIIGLITIILVLLGITMFTKKE